jgi:hypothetical protein
MAVAANVRGSLILPIAGWIVAAILATLLGIFVAPSHMRIRPGDSLQIDVLGTIPDMPIAGKFEVDHWGAVSLGSTSYGSVDVNDRTLVEAREAITLYLRQQLTAPEVKVRFAPSGLRGFVERAAPAISWATIAALCLLLALTTVRSYTVPEPRRKVFQFGLTTLLWLTVVVALAVFAFNERRERLNTEATRLSRPTVSPYL